MYTPAFTEIFIGWCAVVGWAAYLRPRVPDGPSLAVVAALPWLTGAIVMLGQIAAVIGLMDQSPTSATWTAKSLIRTASWASAGVIGFALVVELFLTVFMRIRGKRE